MIRQSVELGASLHRDDSSCDVLYLDVRDGSGPARDCRGLARTLTWLSDYPANVKDAERPAQHPFCVYHGQSRDVVSSHFRDSVGK